MARQPIEQNEVEVRRDTIRITPKFNRLLENIKKTEGIKNNSDAWRLALETYEESRGLVVEVHELKDEIKALKESLEDLNFFIRAKLNKE